jgi:hypothetical protein
MPRLAVLLCALAVAAALASTPVAAGRLLLQDDTLTDTSLDTNATGLAADTAEPATSLGTTNDTIGAPPASTAAGSPLREAVEAANVTGNISVYANASLWLAALERAGAYMHRADSSERGG